MGSPSLNSIYSSLISSRSQNLQDLASSAKSLSTGTRDVSHALLAQGDSFKRSASHLQSINSSLQATSGYLSSQEVVLDTAGSLVDDLEGLAMLSSDPLLNNDDRSALNAEFQSIKSQISDLTEDASFNGLELFDNSFDVRINESGGTFSIDELESGNLSLNGGVKIDTLNKAEASLEDIEDLRSSLNAQKATVGSNQRFLGSVIDINQNAITHLEESRASIQDVDVAKEIARFTAIDLRRQATESIMSSLLTAQQTQTTNLLNAAFSSSGNSYSLLSDLLGN